MPDFRLGRLNGRFVVTWYDDLGKRHRWRLNAATAVEAKAELARIKREHEELARPRHTLTVGDLWSQYVEEKRAEGKVSVSRMEDAWKSLKETFEAIRPSDVTPLLVREYTTRRRTKVGDGTIHTELGYLRAALRSGGEAVSIKLPSKPRPKSKHITPAQARTLIDAAHMPHIKLFILLSIYTAGRPSSILDLTWDRVSLERLRIQLDNPSRDRTAKGRATVPLAPALVDPLVEARRAAQTDYVIEWAGQRVRSIKKGFAEACRRAGLSGVTPYVLRHSAAVFMAEGGVPMSELSQYLGHTSTAVTERVYARYSPEHLRRGAEAIHTALFGAPNRNKRT